VCTVSTSSIEQQAQAETEQIYAAKRTVEQEKDGE